MTAIPPRLPPHDVDAERAALGSPFVSPAAFDELAELDVDDFALPAHRDIFEAMRELSRRRQPIDVFLVAGELKARELLGRLDGGISYLTDLANGVPTAAHARHYANVVRDRATLRKLIAVAADVSSRAYAGGTAGAELVIEARGALDRLMVATAGAVPASAGVPTALDTIEARSKAYAEGMRITGARMGVTQIDEKTGGLKPGWLVVVAAETGGGKTALAMQTAIDVALRGGTALAVNLEMPGAELYERAITWISDVNSNSIRTGAVTPADWKAIQGRAAALAGSRLFVEESASTMPQILAAGRRWRSANPDRPGVMVVDFLQLVRSAGGNIRNRAQEVGGFAYDLKALAKELAVPVILVSQLNRAAVKSGERPSKSDLKESGDIENAADLILLPWNKDAVSDGWVEIIADKFRHGQKFTAAAWWRGSRYSFTDNQPQGDRYAR